MGFHLVGFSDIPHWNGTILALFIFSYILTLLGNLLIILLIVVDSLNMPMYKLLFNLSLLDVSFTSVTVPKMLTGLLVAQSRISFSSCFIQLYFFHFLGSAECFLLSIMGYDRYVAICHPLRYTQIMSNATCIKLASSCWLMGSFYSSIHTIMTANLSYCSSREVNHFFCDMPPLLKLSCTDTKTNMIVILGLGGLAASASFLLTILSYIFILSSILMIRSTGGRQKTFSTCASHLAVVTIFYGTIIFMYLRPQSSYSLEHDKMISVFYNVITPMLNPLIYCLRNKDVMRGARRLWKNLA
uniref:Olfactory receptor n=1 Tax=Leptobrachium leishanense TaxID=445787 RepID=A0A8C5QC06_9ANUR